jgi:hypothetical protein
MDAAVTQPYSAGQGEAVVDQIAKLGPFFKLLSKPFGIEIYFQRPIQVLLNAVEVPTLLHEDHAHGGRGPASPGATDEQRLRPASWRRQRVVSIRRRLPTRDRPWA